MEKPLNLIRGKQNRKYNFPGFHSCEWFPSFRSPVTDSLARWVLQMGECVVVKAPESLREPAVNPGAEQSVAGCKEPLTDPPRRKSRIPNQGKYAPTLRKSSVTVSMPSLTIQELSSCFPLPWSAYIKLLSVKDPCARAFYETEALRGGWTIKQLDRQINSLFYERTALSKYTPALPDLTRRKSG